MLSNGYEKTDTSCLDLFFLMHFTSPYQATLSMCVQKSISLGVVGSYGGASFLLTGLQ